MSRAEVSSTMGRDTQNHLLEFLGTFHDWERVKQTAWEYCVGTWAKPGELKGAAVLGRSPRRGSACREGCAI